MAWLVLISSKLLDAWKVILCSEAEHNESETSNHCRIAHNYIEWAEKVDVKEIVGEFINSDSTAQNFDRQHFKVRK